MSPRQAIKRLRSDRTKFADLTAIAATSGLHVNTLIAIKRGDTDNPRLETVEAIAAYFSPKREKPAA
jgi:DNA-binding XRE family transcriptional regulator